MRAAACVRNTSGQPVYDIAIGLGEEVDQRWPVLMPEDEFVRPGLGTAFAIGERPVWVAFRDSADVCWRAMAHGQPAELPGEEGSGAR